MYDIWLKYLSQILIKNNIFSRIAGGKNRYVNSVSLIDRTARIVFPTSFAILQIIYWLAFFTYQKEFTFTPIKGAKVKY